VILFLAANPAGTDRLALDREARPIHAELRRSGYRDRFDFVTRWAAEPLNLLRELRELKPTVVHFSGHGRAAIAGGLGSLGGRDVNVASASAGGDRHGLYLHDPAGRAQLVTPGAISQAFGAAGTSVKAVALNACYTAPIAEALLVRVDCVLGNHRIDPRGRGAELCDQVLHYGGLGEHEPIEAAFKQGRAAINLDGVPDADLPGLQVGHGLDAEQLILAATVS
jgi:hypothetical protein